MTQSLFAVTLVVPDYDDAIAFYTQTLSFTLLQDVDLGGGKRWVRVAPPGPGDASLLLAKADGPSQTAAVGNQTGGRVGFFLQTDDFQRDYNAMVTAGVHFEEDPRNEPYGIVAVWRDPCGNRWDLIQFT
ncbi:VOC family protein [Ruegeria sp. Alg231-54]|uniref:VOC family protein n=1 Tax=Ruegeria sp. Alg231-54 TaxID=1922221 RepID=UPI000D5534BC|nr:VOC family protein [Ruegeria sp. Alg231-54]